MKGKACSGKVKGKPMVAVAIKIEPKKKSKKTVK